MFATGIENSIPTINNGKTRVDQMEAAKFYKFWREDFDAVQELGIHFLRYGPPLHKTFLGPEKYDWEFADLTLNELKRRDITPIVSARSSEPRRRPHQPGHTQRRTVRRPRDHGGHLRRIGQRYDGRWHHGTLAANTVASVTAGTPSSSTWMRPLSSRTLDNDQSRRARVHSGMPATATTMTGMLRR